MVKGASGTRGGGTAFTGSSQIPFGTLMIVVLVVAGVAALFVARRRAARFAG
jgi:LPXTG-motif cell wall-anchored protein